VERRLLDKVSAWSWIQAARNLDPGVCWKSRQQRQPTPLLFPQSPHHRFFAVAGWKILRSLLCEIPRSRSSPCHKGKAYSYCTREGNKSFPWPVRSHAYHACSKPSLASGFLQVPGGLRSPGSRAYATGKGGRGAGGWLARIYPSQRSRVKNAGRKLVEEN
jgi:hypothetical protein